MLCKCGCGKEVSVPATGRPGEYHSPACRKRAQRARERAMQLELISDVTKPEEVAEQEETSVTKPNTPESWTIFSKSDRKHDAQRRGWLRAWGQEHDVQRGYWFTMWGRYSGYYQTQLLPGKWAHFVEDAGSYEIYCLFVAVFTPGVPLAYYVEDAAMRGEIKGLVTKPSVRASLQSELLAIGKTIAYQRVTLATKWGGVHIQPGREGWTHYALTEKEHLSLVVQRLLVYAKHLISAGLSGVAKEQE